MTSAWDETADWDLIAKYPNSIEEDEDDETPNVESED